MNKKLLLIAALAATVAAADAQTVYQTDFSTSEEFAKWQVVDANNDEATWKFDSEGTPSKVYYPYSATNDADDWLISPAITADKDATLAISFTTQGTSYGESMDVWTGKEATVEAMATKQGSYDKIPLALTPGFFLVEVKKGEPLHVGFHCTSAKDHWKFYMVKFEAKVADNPVDLSVTKLNSPATANGLTNAETVSITIENKGTATAKNVKAAYAIDGGKAVEEAVNQDIEPGKSLEYTFSTKADLSTPRHNYAVKAYTISDDDVFNGNDSILATVRHQAPVTPPYSTGFEKDKEDLSDYKFYNLNNDDGDWSLYSDPWMPLQRTGNFCLGYNYNSDNAADDWAVLSPISVEAGTYVLRFWLSSTDDTHREKLGVYWGTGDTPTDMVNEVYVNDSIVQPAYQEVVSFLTFDKAQTIYLGFHAFSDKDQNWIVLDDLSFYKADNDAVDLVADAMPKPYDYVRTPNNKDVEFAIRSVGIKDTKADVKIFVDDKETFTQNDIEVKAQENKTITATGALEGLAEGRHTLKAVVTSDDDKTNDNDTIAREIVVLGQPTLLYDMEDGKLPAALNFATLDEGTVNPDAGSEFNEQGWGIISIDTHPTLGNYVLAGTSWLDNTAKADRWAILPTVHVGEEGGAYFVWDAASGNPGFLETYNVCVSDGSTNPADYWYTSEAKISNESVNSKTRGISLDDYAGKDVAIAFNLKTEIGDFLSLDNIGVYGSATTTGINATPGDAEADQTITLVGKTIYAPGASLITLTDLSGRTVLKADGQAADASSLKPGIYVASNGKKAVKVVLK